MPVWPWIFIERESSWGCSLRKSFIQCHINTVFAPTSKPSDTMKDIYDGQTYELKTRVDIWTRLDVVPVEDGTFYQTFHLTMWFFQFINSINSKWDYMICCIISLLVWIGHWNKLSIYIVPPDLVRWYCQGFGYLWQSLMVSWMLWSKNDLKVSHRNEFNAPSNMELETSLMNFECHSCGIFEVLSQHQ